MKICSGVEGLRPYQGGKPISELKRELGLSDIVKLASNENPSPVSQQVLNAAIKSIAEMSRYPDGNGFSLKTVLAKKLNLTIGQVTLGNGSNDVLELIARAFICNTSDEVIFSQYTFVVYPLVTQALGAKAVITPAQNFGHDLDAMLLAITHNTRLIFIANPNNPTGTLLSETEIYAFLKQVPSSVVVVLDQAYIEYLNTPDVSILWLAEFENLIITRTFSKAYGLAGLRVGYGLSSEKISDFLNRIRQPFNVNVVAQATAVAALDDAQFLQSSISNNSKGLLQLTQGFTALELKYIPSFANFVAVRFEDAEKVYQKLLQCGLIVRPIEIPQYLRISVGLPSENEKLLQALRVIINE
jgi:histidinol-phosphate aminotransferase